MSALYLNTHYSIAFQYDFQVNTLDMLAEAIYGEGHAFLPVSMLQLENMFGDRSELNYKHSMIIRYLEVLLVYSLSEETVKNNKNLYDILSEYRTMPSEKYDWIREYFQITSK